MESLANMPVAEVSPNAEMGDPLHLHPPPEAVYEPPRNDDTPTNERPQPLNLNTTLDYSPIDPYTEGPGANDFGYSQQPADSDWGHHDYDAYAPPSHGYPDYSSQSHAYQPDPDSPVEMPQPLVGGGLRVANRTSMISDEGDDWGSEALKQMNLKNK